MEQKPISKVLVAGIVIVLVGIIIFFLPKKSEAPATTTDTTSNTPSTPLTSTSSTPTATVPGKSKYKDGTYTAKGSYNSPGGLDDLTVSVTIKNGIIVDSMVTKGAHDATSDRMQDVFIANYKPLVIGKSIDSVVLTKVSGSSLTGFGFNEAISKIQVQAQS